MVTSYSSLNTRWSKFSPGCLSFSCGHFLYNSLEKVIQNPTLAACAPHVLVSHPIQFLIGSDPTRPPSGCKGSCVWSFVTESSIRGDTKILVWLLWLFQWSFLLLLHLLQVAIESASESDTGYLSFIFGNFTFNSQMKVIRNPPLSSDCLSSSCVFSCLILNWKRYNSFSGCLGLSSGRFLFKSQ